MLPLCPALGEIHLAITFVLRCSCRAWGWGAFGVISADQVLLLAPNHVPTMQPFTLLPVTHARLSPIAGPLNKLFSEPRCPPHLCLSPEPLLTCLLARTYTFSFSIFTCRGSTAQDQTLECFSPQLCATRLPLCHTPSPTWNLCRLSRPGKSSRSPVLMLKQAPCQGQRTRPRDNTPGTVWY